MNYIRYLAILCSLIPALRASAIPAFPTDYQKKRVLITTDIGGGDKDDTQSMIHFLLYADMFDLEGIVIGRPRGDISEMMRVLRAYEKDYPKLATASSAYPSPASVRSVVRVGARRNQRTPSRGWGFSTSGSRKIIQAAQADDPRPLYVLSWGSVTDIAQAIHDAPSIKPKLRLFSITSARTANYNEFMDPSPARYLRRNHRDLIWIEGGESARGIYLRGMGRTSRYGNVGFVKQVIKPRGALGALFYSISAKINVNAYGIKMGDTPSLLFLFNGDFEHPEQDSWGGRFCRIYRRYYSDCTAASLALGRHPGAVTVGIHRVNFLKDFEERLGRL